MDKYKSYLTSIKNTKESFEKMFQKQEEIIELRKQEIIAEYLEENIKYLEIAKKELERQIIVLEKQAKQVNPPYKLAKEQAIKVLPSVKKRILEINYSFHT